MIQSQALSLAQNKNNELFIGTMGGLSRFNGSQFTHYTRSDGLSSNIIYTLDIDSNQNIWMGTLNGICKFDGRKIHTYNNQSNSLDALQLVVDNQNDVWTIDAAGNLFTLHQNQLKPVKTPHPISAIAKDKEGQLWAFQEGKGLLKKNQQDWEEVFLSKQGLDWRVYKLYFGKVSNKLYVITNKGLYVKEGNQWLRPIWLNESPKVQNVTNIIEDEKGSLWIATNGGGAWMKNGNNWTYFNYNNGFTDEFVTSFFEDNENNMWLATNGSGIFRFSGNDFVYYDRNSGLSSASTISVAKAKGGGVYTLGSDQVMSKIKAGHLQKLSNEKVPKGTNILFTDQYGITWIGTENNGLWKIDNEKITPVHFNNERGGPYHIIQIYEINNKLWIVTRTGLWSIEEETLQKEIVLAGLYSMASIGTDSILLGTFNGAFIYKPSTKTLSTQPFLSHVTVLSIQRIDNKIFIATDEKGLAIYDLKLKSFRFIDRSNGLNCNYIYSVYIDHQQQVWLGTGCGISRIHFKENEQFSVWNVEQSLGMESNSGAIVEDKQKNIWLATNLALFRYNPNANTHSEKKIQTPIIFQSVKLFSKEITKKTDSLLPFSNLPYHPIFLTNENNLSFSYIGVSLANATKIKYRYQLQGIDKQFTETDQTTVVYPNLPPGDYVFEVWASNEDGTWSQNSASFPFTINTPFYNTNYFKIGIVLLILSIIMGWSYYRYMRQQARLKWMQRLKEEEQERIRQKTAEDFHDEIGNKLTRIQLLTTLAERKLSEENELAIRSLLLQIKENAQQLYKGSKDIIWFLQGQSDYLDVIIQKIIENTNEFIESSDIQLKVEDEIVLNRHLKLPMDYSRNIILIFKEAVNNMLKYAQASEVQLSFKKEEEDIVISLKDNGVGIDKNAERGNGLINMHNRAQRIKGELEILTEAQKGTEIILRFPLPKERF